MVRGTENSLAGVKRESHGYLTSAALLLSAILDEKDTTLMQNAL